MFVILINIINISYLNCASLRPNGYGGGGEERRRRRGAAAGSCGEELGAHDRGGVRSGGAAAQGKGHVQSLTSQVHPAAMQPAA